MSDFDPAIRAAHLSNFLHDAGWADAKRIFVQGDASLRRYERLMRPAGTAILMDWPAGPDAPVASGHSAYSKLAHLAEDIRPFVAVGTHLKGQGLRAPDIFAADFAHGFLLLEDLGAHEFGRLIDAGAGPSGQPLDELYKAGIETLVALQRGGHPASLPVGEGSMHRMPAFDDGIFRIETAMPLDWYMPVVMGVEPSIDQRAEFEAIWTSLWPEMEAGPKTLFLRDFHSPNILWQEGATGLDRIGLIDYQDALIGSIAYDPVSFLQDARKDVSRERETAMKRYYVERMKQDDAGFDEERFDASYALFGAERALRLMGLWPRLLKRDNKPHYMQHMERTQDYLNRNLSHPVLRDLARFVEEHFLKDAPPPGKTARPSA
ncbi:MAG: phosphotransferase [Parvibaculum sp.]